MKQNANKKSLNEFINDNYQEWLKKAMFLTKDKVRSEELLHTVLIRFLNKNKDKQLHIYNEGNLNGYISRSMWLSWYSSSSDYYSLYKKYIVVEQSTKQLESTDETWIGAFIDGEYLYNAIGRLNEFDAILLRLYSKPDFNYQQLSAETGIPYNYLRISIHRALKRIREYVKLQRSITNPERKIKHL
jgi:DNA-directed RNA polymerase specialized sigma24 family protein